MILNILTLTTSALVNADDILVKFGGVQNGKVLEWKIDRKHLESAERSKMTANQLLLIPLDDLHQIAMTAVIDKNVRRLTASPEPFWPIEEDLKISENRVSKYCRIEAIFFLMKSNHQTPRRNRNIHPFSLLHLALRKKQTKP